MENITFFTLKGITSSLPNICGDITNQFFGIVSNQTIIPAKENFVISLR